MFALICTAYIPTDTLNTFLTKAYTNTSSLERLHLITSSDITTPPQPTEPPISTPENPTHTPPSSYEHEAKRFVSEKLAPKYPEINSKIICILDSHTLSNETCLIASTTYEASQSEDEHACHVRCQAGYAIDAMVALVSGEKTRSQLVNAAALAGGAIGPYNEPVVEDIVHPATRSMISKLSESEVPEDWYCVYGLIPVFCTVDIPTNTLDELLNLAHLENDNENPHTGLYVVQNPTLDYAHATSSQPPLQTITHPFLGASIAHLSLFCKHKLRRPIQNSAFVVLDQYSLTEKSTLLVDNNWTYTSAEKARTGELLMCRASFADTYVTLGGLNAKGSLFMDEHAVTAADMGGVLRVFEEAVRMHGPVQHKALKIEDVGDEDSFQEL